MKKLENVSIGHIAFTLEEDAYTVISQYLKDKAVEYGCDNTGRGILEDIEICMAKHLNERLSADGIVSRDMAEHVISIIGKPTQYIMGKRIPKNQKIKKLSRNTKDRIIGGVCSGLATYFDVDPTIIRVISSIIAISFVILDIRFFYFCYGLLLPAIYLIMWLIVPAANTNETKDTMHDATSTSEYAEADAKVEGYNPSENRGRFLGRILAVLCSLLLICIGLCGLCSGILLIGGLNSPWMTNLFDKVELSYCLSSSFPAIQNIISSPVLICSGILVYFLPCIGMIYAGIMGIFHISAPKWRPGMTIALLWIVAVLVLVCALAVEII